MMVRRRAARTVIGLTSLVLLTGCSGSGSSSDDAPEPSVSSSASDRPTDAPQGAIDLDGAEGSPITWQLPAGTTATDPVGVAQQYIAIIQQVGVEGAALDPDIVDSIAERAPAASARNAISDGPVDGQTSTGPVWVWLDAAEENGDRAVVKGCADVGYFQPDGAATPAEFPAEAWYTGLQRVEDAAGNEVWKVSEFNTGPVNDADPFEMQCPAWATHTP